jgi:VWFA-related protein
MRQSRVSPSVVVLACLAFALASALPAAAQIAAGQDFGERVEVNTVNVEVHVSDKSGRPVTGLQRGDFALFEDGKPMAVANFDAVARQAVAVPEVPIAPAVLAGPGAPAASPPAAAREPASWILYVDDVYIRAAHRARVLGQLLTFVTVELVPGDQVMLVTYDHGLHVRLPFTGDRAALARALDKVENVAADSGELDRARHEALQRILETLDVEGGNDQADKMQKRGRGAGDEARDDDGGGGGFSQQCPAGVSEPVKTYAAAVRHEVLGSISALTVLVNSLSGVPGRKVLIHISDGIPLTPGEELFQVLYQICGGGAAMSGLQGSALPVYSGNGSGGYKATQSALDAQAFSTANEWTAFTAHANAQRVTLYTLQASGAEAAGAGADMGPEDRVLTLPEVSSIESQNRQQPLSAMASDTGGRAIFWANDIRPDLARIQEDLASYYSLGFNPPHTGDGREHRIEVRVKRSGLSGITVRYRQSYRDKPALERAVDHTLSSLFYGYQDNPLDVRLEIGATTSQDAKTWRVPVRLRIPLFKLGLRTSNDNYEGKLRVLVAVRDTEGGNTPVRQIEVPVRIPHVQAITALGQFYLYELTLTLGKGEQHLAVAVRDEATTTTSFLARTLRLGAPEKPAPALWQEEP